MPDYPSILAGYWSDAADRVREMILHPHGSQSSPWNQARYLQQYSRIMQELQKAKKVGGQVIGKSISDAVSIGNQSALDQLSRMHWKNIPAADSIVPNFSLIDTRTIEVLAADTAASAVTDLHRAADSTAQAIGRTLRKMADNGLTPDQVNAAIARGMIDGDKASVIREIRDSLRNVNDGRVTIINKNSDPMTFDAGEYARMVVNTRMREASIFARHDRLQAEGIDLVIIIGRNSVHFCTHYLGKVYSLSGKDPEYPAYSTLPDGGPPFHPNCSKSTAPFVRGLKAKEVLRNASTDPDDPMLRIKDKNKLERAFKDLQLKQLADARQSEIVRDIDRRARQDGYNPPPWSPTKQEAKAYTASVGFTPEPKTFWTEKSATDWGERTFRQLADLMPESQKKAIRDYQGTDFREMNAIAAGKDNYYLPGSDKTAPIPQEDIPELKKKVEQAIAAFSQSSLPESVTSFRGTTAKRYGLILNRINQNLVGKTIINPSFTSSSLLLEKGKEFSANQADHIVMDIVSPKGTRALFLNPILDRISDEMELAFPPGTRFKVLEVSLKPVGSEGRQVPYIKMEVIP